MIISDHEFPGPDGAWLDTTGTTSRTDIGQVHGIKRGRSSDANVVLSWYKCGDALAPAWKTCRLLAFSCRNLEIFQTLVVWDGDNEDYHAMSRLEPKLDI